MMSAVVPVFFLLCGAAIALCRVLRKRSLQGALARQFLQDCPTPFLVLDHAGTIHHINHAAAQLFGYSADDIRGQSMSQLIAAPTTEQMKILESVLHPLAPTRGLCTVPGRSRDNTSFSLELRTRSVTYKGKRWILVGARDLTSDHLLKNALRRYVDQLSQSKEALQRYNADLEKLVEEKTQKLRVAIDAAEQANSAKSDFLTNMSHELRTPLHGILSFSRFGVKKCNTEDREKLRLFFRRIESAGETLLKLLNELLDLSKLEAHAVTLECESILLPDLVTDVIDEFSAVTKERGLKIEFECVDPQVAIWADSAKLAQVIRNVLGNAVKFTPAGGQVRVAVVPSPETATVSVCDTGPGIPDDECEKVFDKFLQSSSAQTNVEGTGLGLAICREIVQLHQGSIRAIPTHGHGAHVEVTVPRKKEVSVSAVEMVPTVCM